jgi:colanic acid biosynthesis protein WcaH
VTLASFRESEQSAKPAMSTPSRITPPQLLGDDDFAFVVRNAPLVSIDVIIKDPERRVLLGCRVNEPAKGVYFVPGGVIRKNEAIQAAFARILKVETGLQASIDRTKFIGVFEHFYDTNRFGDPEFGTHYVVLAYKLSLEERPSAKLDSQYSKIRWLSDAKILSAKDVHPYTKAYTKSIKGRLFWASPIVTSQIQTWRTTEVCHGKSDCAAG